MFGFGYVTQTIMVSRYRPSVSDARIKAGSSRSFNGQGFVTIAELMHVEAWLGFAAGASFTLNPPAYRPHTEPRAY